jgi:hypothetical protein
VEVVAVILPKTTTSAVLLQVQMICTGIHRNFVMCLLLLGISVNYNTLFTKSDNEAVSEDLKVNPVKLNEISVNKTG